jgi:hypothetical protein
MQRIEEHEILKSLEILSKIEPDACTAEQALARTRERLLEKARKTETANLWRKIMENRIAKFAAAAVVLITIGVFVYWHSEKVGLTSVAWAQVAEKIQQIPSVVYKMKTEMTGLPNRPKNSPLISNAIIYSSMEFGTRMDNSVDGNSMSQTFVNPAKRLWLTVMPATKKYIKLTYTDEAVAKMGKSSDPRQMVNAFTKFGYKDIGYSTINGLLVAGIEVNDVRIFGGMLDKGIGHLWIDTKTQLPVLMEFEGTAANDSVTSKMTMYDFEWNIDLDANVFEPNIGSDYSVLADMKLPQNDETSAIKGLKLFSDVSGGAYPSNLSMLTVMREYENCGVYKAFKGKSGKDEPNEAVRQEVMQKTTLILSMYSFYAKLQSENKDPKYYGDKVRATDSNLILLQWKISDHQFRAIYGDLHIEDISPGKLAE